MSLGFWAQIKKPAFVLAPMADVTDAAFRRIIATYGKPDVMWTEFVSADGLALAPLPGQKKLLKHLEYSEIERPIVAQFFTSSPDNMRKAAILARKLKFDGIDINMGCPDKNIEKQGAGASLMKNVKLARALVRAAKVGAGPLPVSVKTRIGYSKPELEHWLPEILEENPAVVTIHARTRREMSKVPARWEFVKLAVELRDRLGKDTLIFGNGDAEGIDDARRKCEETGADGVMLGRAIFGNPWLFSQHHPSIEERLGVLKEHINLFDKLFKDHKNFAVMKKHFKAYLVGIDRAPSLRTELMEADNPRVAEQAINNFLLT